MSRNQIITTSLCLSYVFLHMTIAIYSIRFWPFTDYPMFSDPIQKTEPIFVYKYYLLKSDGSRTPLSRSFANGYGIGELNLTALLGENDLKLFKKVLSRWYQKQNFNHSVLGITITRVDALKPHGKNEVLQISEDLVLTLLKEEFHGQ